MYTVGLLITGYALVLAAVDAFISITSYSSSYPDFCGSGLYWIRDGGVVNLTCAYELDAPETVSSITFSVNDEDEHLWNLLTRGSAFLNTWLSDGYTADNEYHFGTTSSATGFSSVSVVATNTDPADYECTITHSGGTFRRSVVIHNFTGDINDYPPRLVSVEHDETISSCGSYKFLVIAPKPSSSGGLCPDLIGEADGEAITCEQVSENDNTVTAECTVPWGKYKGKSIKVTIKTNIAGESSDSRKFTLEPGVEEWVIPVTLVIELLLSVALVIVAVIFFLKANCKQLPKIILLSAAIVLAAVTVILTIVFVAARSESSSDCRLPGLMIAVIFSVLEVILLVVIPVYWIVASKDP